MNWGEEQDMAINDILWRATGYHSDCEKYKSVIDNQIVICDALKSWQELEPVTRTCKITIDQTGIKCKLIDQSVKNIREASSRSSVSVTHAAAWAMYYFSEARWVPRQSPYIGDNT